MINNKTISFIFIIDNNSMMYPEFKTRIWFHEKLVRKLLKTEICLMGRNTYELTHWSGPKSHVLTNNRNWKRPNVNVIYDIDEFLSSSINSKIYILGGQSLFNQLYEYVDELHMFVVNLAEGSEEFPKISMIDWDVTEYKRKVSWSYGKLKKKIHFNKNIIK